LTFFHVIARAATSTLSPYTTLFRSVRGASRVVPGGAGPYRGAPGRRLAGRGASGSGRGGAGRGGAAPLRPPPAGAGGARHRGRRDRKSTRLNSSHVKISYAVFCLKK